MMRSTTLLPLLAFLALFINASAAQSVIGEDNQIFTGLSPLPSDPYKLHSRPGAAKTIYLDFSGLNPVVNSPWSAGRTILMPAYSGTAQNIKNIWLRVADAFAPFNVDVTTEPPAGGITPRMANFQRCIIGGNNFMVDDPLGVPEGTVENPNAWTGGTSYLNSATNAALIAAFDEIPCFVFPDPPFVLSEVEIAAAICHQLGHTMGLGHKGVANTIQDEWNSGNVSKDGVFYFGHGGVNNASSWGPLMGLPIYGQSRQSWAGPWYVKPTVEPFTRITATGDFSIWIWTDNSSNRTDEFQVLTNFLGAAVASVPAGSFIPGNSVGLPSSLALAGGTFLKGGINHSFSFMANPGPISIKVRTVQPIGGTAYNPKVVSSLKVALSLSDQRGRVLYKGVRGTYPEQGAEIKFTATTTGIYLLTITSVGSLDNVNGSAYGGGPYVGTPYETNLSTFTPKANLGIQYDCYASAGRYALSGSWTAPTYIAPTPKITTSASSITFGTTVNFAATATDPNIGGNGLYTYAWDFGDVRSATNKASTINAATSNVSHQYNAPGTYTASLLVTNSFGKTSVAYTKVITVTGTAPNALRVGSVVGSTWRRVNSVAKGCVATINVIDQYSLPVEGAVVNVTVTGTVAGKSINYSVAVKTDVSGNASFSTTSYPLQAVGTLTCTVKSIVPSVKMKGYPTAVSPAGGVATVTVPVVN